MFDLIVQLLRYCSDHFDMFVYANAALLCMLLVIYILVNRSDIKPKIKPAINQFLLVVVVIGESLMLFLTGYIYWDNHRQGICVTILQDTFWAKSDFPVYFISDKNLVKINVDGKGFKYIFTAPDPLREYHFSPDGKSILIVTDHELYWFDRKEEKAELIDSLGGAVQEGKAKGFIAQVRWAPDSRKFCYALYRWSPVASQDSFYVYDRETGKRNFIKNFSHKISELFWDEEANNLYYSHYSMKALQSPQPYQVEIFRIPLLTMSPEPVESFRSKTYDLPALDLGSRKINLYAETAQLGFKRKGEEKKSAVSENGSKVILESNNSLYFESASKRRIKLFRFAKGPDKKNAVIDDMAWVPGGQFVVLAHHKLGVLLVKPSAGKMGELIDIPAEAFGWYEGGWFPALN